MAVQEAEIDVAHVKIFLDRKTSRRQRYSNRNCTVYDFESNY